MQLRAVLSSISAALRSASGLDSLLSSATTGLAEAGFASGVRLLHEGRLIGGVTAGPVPDPPPNGDPGALVAALLALPPVVVGLARDGHLEPTLPPDLPADHVRAAWGLGLPERGAVALAPLVSRGRLLGALLLVGGADCPFRADDLWWVGEVASRLAEAVAASQRESELNSLNTLVEHLPSGVVLAEPGGGLRICNEAAWHIFRASPRTRVRGLEEWRWVVAQHADGRPVAVDDWPLARTLRTGEHVRGEEIRITRADGTPGTIRIHSVAIRSSSGEITGGASVFEDITDQAAAKAALRESEQQLRMVADAVPVLISLLGRDRRYRFANSAYREIWGEEVVIGKTVDDLLGRGAETTRPHLDAAFEGRRVHYQAEFETRDGTARVMDVDYVPRRAEDGIVDSVVVLSRDVTEARRAEDRMAFLADASRVLSSSLDIDENLRALGVLAVPRFADWLVIEVPDPSGTMVPHTLHHQDAAMVAAARELRQRWPTRAQDEPLMRDGAGVLRQGKDDEPLCAGAQDAEHLAAMRKLGLHSNIRVAISTSRGRFGVLCVATAESRRRLTPADLALSSEVASRIGLSIDNARLLEELKAADRNKEEFIAMLAHELRNPMAPILTGLQLLHTLDATAGAAGPAAEATARTLATIERQTTKLARLVDDLLDVSRINRGRIDLSPVSCDLSAIVSDAVETVRPVVEARRHELTVRVPAGVHVQADPVRLEQVFANLIDNAAKYTEPGGHLRVEARVHEGDTTREGAEAPPRVEVAIADDGAGIPPELLPHVFQLFHQGHVGLDRGQGGLGLGLTLVDRLVRLHGGAVRAESAGPGRGSTFFVSLPLAPLGGEPTQVPLVWVEAAGPPRSVLVVDDNIDAALATTELLERLGHRVQAVHDGSSCLAAVARSAPEVVLLDIGLPGIDGFEVARRLRAGGYGGRIVAVTGYGRAQDREASRAAGFDDHLVKPVGAPALLVAIRAGSCATDPAG
jgi:PAS domain S-box-containing protein